MAVGGLSARALAVAMALTLTGGILAVSAEPALAVTCPTVNQLTRAVTPAPAPGVDWSGCDLGGADLANADLSGANLTSTTLTSATLAGANLQSTGLTGSTLFGIRSGGITGTPASLPAGWSLVSGYLIGPEANLDGADLRGADLSGADLFAARLIVADLAGSNLSGADLTGAGLAGVRSGGVTGTPSSLPLGWSLVSGYLIGTEANLADADLAGLDLSGTDLADADLAGADLAGTNLTSTFLSGARLTSANLSGANLTGAYLRFVVSGGITGIPASLPADWSLVGGYLIGPAANLAGASLAGANLSGADLAHAELVNASLAGADLTNANLNYANLRGAGLAGASMTGASLFDVQSGGITGTPSSLPANWLLVNGYLAGPGADLYFAKLGAADLSHADLAGAFMADATLTSANLNGANLTGTNLAYANLTSANLTGASAAGGTLYGANVTSANLTGASLAGADLTDATLDGANLTRADLKGASVTGAIFTNAIWMDTTCPNGLSSDDYVDGCFSQRLYGLSGFISPLPGSTLARSAGRIVVRFRFTNAAGRLIASSTAATLAAQHRVEAVLTGPRIAKVSAACTWDKTARYFLCVIKIPAGVETGKNHSYFIAALEKLGNGFADAPADPGAVNPEIVHFR